MSAQGSSSASATRSTRTKALLAAGAVIVVVAVALAATTLIGRGGHAGPRAGARTTAPAGTTKGERTGFRLVVDSLGIDAPIVSITLGTDRVLDPPANAREVGWWNGSAQPGARTGQTIITGHTVHTGGGQLDHLGEMKTGATIDLVRNGTDRAYKVTKVFTLTKSQVTQKSVALFGQQRVHNRLVLITCDDWTGSEYLKNTFVYATPLTPNASAAA